MKSRVALLSTLLICLSPLAHADFQLGVKAGMMDVGFDDVEVTSDPTSVAVSLGYNFGRSGFGVEAEATRTITAGTVIGTDLEVESQGVYLTYTTSGRFYFTGRVGFMDAGLVAEGLSEDEGGETYGVGVGLKLSKRMRIGIDYTSIDDDINFLSVGFKF